jgi:putative FmdB family regulatory protein
MPVYEYTCKKCDARFEKLLRSMSRRDEKVECPKCGSKDTSRALSVFAVASQQKSSSSPPPGMCGRCGGPGPCALD